VSEALVMNARAKGLAAKIILPGFIMCNSDTGVCNTEDFIWRLAQYCVISKTYPLSGKNAVVVMTPVDHLVDLMIKMSTTDDGDGLCYIRQDVTFNEFFESIQRFGYDLKAVSHQEWVSALKKDIARTDSVHPLMPLLHTMEESMEGYAVNWDNNRRPTLDLRPVLPDMLDSIPKGLAYLVSVGMLLSPTSGDFQGLDISKRREAIGRTGRKQGN